MRKPPFSKKPRNVLIVTNGKETLSQQFRSSIIAHAVKCALSWLDYKASFVELPLPNLRVMIKDYELAPAVVVYGDGIVTVGFGDFEKASDRAPPPYWCFMVISTNYKGVMKVC